MKITFLLRTKDIPFQGFFFAPFFVMRKMSIFAENTINRIHEHHLPAVPRQKLKNLHYLLFFLRAPHMWFDPGALAGTRISKNGTKSISVRAPPGELGWSSDFET